MPRGRQQLPAEPLTVRDTLSGLTVDRLKPLWSLLLDAKQPTRKDDFVVGLTNALTNPERVAALYNDLDDLGKRAVQEAVHHPQGKLQADMFEAKYGGFPAFSTAGRSYYDDRPTRMRLFFPLGDALPADLRLLLAKFVPLPPPLTIHTIDEVPATVHPLGHHASSEAEDQSQPHVRETARPALHDLQAVLRLVDAGQVRVSETTHRPTAAAQTAVGRVLSEGDFYTDEDRSEWEDDPGADLTIQPFAWPLLLQAADLAQSVGGKLQLTPAGRKATAKPPQDVLRHVWEKWLKTNLLDEYHRIAGVKGQHGKGALTAVPPRREAVVAVLRQVPVQRWVAVDELFRLLRVQAPDFHVARDDWRLYIAEQRYGSLGYNGSFGWELQQGRFVLAFLFEYAATVGLMDVAYVPPAFARADFGDRWGTDDLSCLSRYDGLLFVRLNALGAWCLGLAPDYRPEAIVVRRVVQVLPNLDVVAVEPPLRPADALFLDRFAERTSDAVWHLSAAKLLTAVEEGVNVAELHDYLTARGLEPLPQTVETFLTDLRHKTGQLKDLGAARLVSCADSVVAQLLANDRHLRKYVQLAGASSLVFRAPDEAAVRRGLRELGYVLPPR